MITKILSFIEQAGKLALKNQHGIDFIKSNFKSDGIGDPVTETDTSISKMFQEFISKNFNELDHIIIDEESVLGTRIEDLHVAEYAFIIDPIDGTLTYANKYPLWAISVGVFKNGKPFVGAVYAPALDFLIWADNTKAYCRENGITSELAPLSDDTDSAPIMLDYHDRKKLCLTNAGDDKVVQKLAIYSQILSAMYVATGRARGYYYQAFIWDIAGIMPIFEKVGIKIIGYNDGKEFDLKKDLSANFRANKMFIVSRPIYFDYMKSVSESFI